MANAKANANGYLADIDRVAIVKKRALASDDLTNEDKAALVGATDAITSILTKHCLALGVTPDVNSIARLPQHRKPRANGGRG